MDGMDGYELCHRVRSEPRLQHIRIAFLSGYPPRTEAPSLAQPDVYLMKPVRPAELIAQLHALLGQQPQVKAPLLQLAHEG
jgi:CheY-like chemotaxis protein